MYREEAIALKNAAINFADALAAGNEPLKTYKDLGIAVTDYEAAVCEKAWAETRAAKAMYEEGLLATRRASADMIARYLERQVALEEDIKRLKAVAGVS